MAPKLAPKRAVIGTNIGDENMVEGENIQKAKWDDRNTEIFLKICVEEIQAGNRPHTHFTKEGWKNLLAKFFARTGLSYNHKQLKNRWDALKKEFSIWAKLVKNQTGLGWDPVKKTVLASDDWWERKGQENPEYLKWRNGGPKFLETMEICFKDVVATGYMVLIPYADPSTENEVSNENVHIQTDEVEVDACNFDVEGASPAQDNDTPRAETSTTQDKKRRRMSGGQKKKSASEKLQESFERLVSGMDNMSRTSSAQVEKNDQYSISKCSSLLEMVPNLEEGSPHYYLVVRMFTKRAYRETFVHLMEKNPSLAAGWLNTLSTDKID